MTVNKEDLHHLSAWLTDQLNCDSKIHFVTLGHILCYEKHSVS